MPTNRPTNYQRSITDNTQVTTQERQRQAWELRQRGNAYAYIARVLGYRGPQGAAEAVRAHARRINSGVATETNTSGTTVIRTRRSTVTRLASTRTFGIEAEFFGITPQTAINALAQVGVGAYFEGYNHTTRNHWKIVTDGSVTARGTGQGSGLELVSPVLRGEAGLQQAMLVLDTVRRAGGTVDKSCGLHVHIGMGRASGATIMKVVDLYASNRRNIEKLVARSRWNNFYCQPMNHTDAFDRDTARYSDFRNSTNASVMKRLASDIYSRYRVVNLKSYAKYGTIEFRQHQGTLNGNKMAAWVEFLFALVEKATTMSNASHAYASVADMANSLALTDSTKSYLVRREGVLAR